MRTVLVSELEAQVQSQGQSRGQGRGQGQGPGQRAGELDAAGVARAGVQVPLLQSTVLPARFHHGFTTRLGGVSGGPFASLNLAAKWGDEPRDVAENRRRLKVAAGGRTVFFATQVHGRDSVCVSPLADPAAIAALRADGVLTGTPGAAVGAYVADCVPILIADTRSGACAAVHAGWRGTVAGVVTATLRRMTVEFGTRMSDVRLVIGPSIGPCCFEVGEEVVAAVEGAFAEARTAGAVLPGATQPGGRPHVDLWLLNRLAAESAGVSSAGIDVAGMCTSCDPARFFSYRRDRGITGVAAAFIVCAAQEPRKEMP